MNCVVYTYNGTGPRLTDWAGHIFKQTMIPVSADAAVNPIIVVVCNGKFHWLRLVVQRNDDLSSNCA